MTTTQIVIFGIIFIIDVYLSIIYPVFNLKKEDYAVFHLLRMSILWSLLIGILIMFNDFKHKSEGKCPEFEVIQEPIYKLK